MKKRNESSGFTLISVVIGLLVICAVSATGWYIFDRNQKNNPTASGTKVVNQNKTKAPQTVESKDPSDNGKYLVIKEWGVRFEVPPELLGNVLAYEIQSVTDPDTNLPLEGLNLYISSSALPANVCATSMTSLGSSVKSGIILLRSDTSASFNAARYKGTMKDNVLTDNGHAYHLNYITPDCVGDTNVPKIEALQRASVQLSKI